MNSKRNVVFSEHHFQTTHKLTVHTTLIKHCCMSSYSNGIRLQKFHYLFVSVCFFFYTDQNIKNVSSQNCPSIPEGNIYIPRLYVVSAPCEAWCTLNSSALMFCSSMCRDVSVSPVSCGRGLLIRVVTSHVAQAWDCSQAPIIRQSKALQTLIHRPSTLQDIT